MVSYRWYGGLAGGQEGCEPAKMAVEGVLTKGLRARGDLEVV